MTGRPAVGGLWMVTDDARDPVRTAAAVAAAVAGGVDGVQVRCPHATARTVAALCERLLPVVRAGGARLVVNDRVDVAAIGLADGVHLGQRSLPVERVRKLLPDALLGVSAHDLGELRAAASGGADYATLSPVFATTSKPDVAPIGAGTAAAWTAACGLPVLWLGGITAARISDSAACAGLVGIAALGPFADPEHARQNAVALRAAWLAILARS